MVMLVDATIDTTPAAKDLVTPPARPDASPGAPGSPSSRATYTLREGVGARRLSRFRCKAAIQLLLEEPLI
jgi:brefeldin A-inhibited guanine nucleotide-exchange protein